MVLIWLPILAYIGYSLIMKLSSVGENIFSVCRVLVTVLGTATPLNILPKGTHIYSPRTLSLSWRSGTPLIPVTISTIRWFISSALNESTSPPGVISVSALCISSWVSFRISCILGLLLNGSLSAVFIFSITTTGSFISTS